MGTLVFDEAPSELVFDESPSELVFDKPERELSTVDEIAAGGQKLLDGVGFGFGDEIAAAGRGAIDSLLTGSDFGDSYDMYLAETRAIEDQFTEDNPLLSAGLEVGSSLLPALKVAGAVGNMATRAGNIAMQGGLGGAEMLIREFGEGEGDSLERIKSVDPLWVGVGAAAGGLGGTLMRGQKSVDAIAAQKSGYKDAAGNVTEEGRAAQSKILNNAKGLFDDTYSAVKQEVGDVPARQMVEADSRATRWKQDLHAQGRLPVEELDHLSSTLEKNGKVRKFLADAGAVKWDTDAKGYKAIFSPAGRKKRLDVAIKTLEKTDKEAANTLKKMTQVIGTMQQDLRRVFPNAAQEFQEGYFPLYANATDNFKGFRRATGNAATDDSTVARQTGFITEKQALGSFDNPVNNFMSFFEDTIDSLALARTYGVKSETKTLKGIRSYTDNVVRSIVKAKTPELGEDGAETLGNYLKLYAIDGRKSMGQWANVLRALSHTALLATPENALLQAGDLGQAAYATSFTNSVKALPKALKSVLMTDGDMVVTSGRFGTNMSDTLRMADLGLSRQHLTELVNENRGFWPKHIREWSDRFMTYSGVRGANRLGVETNLNAQIGQMRGIAAKGKDELGKSVYGEGLTPAKLDRLYKGIQSGNVKDPAVMDAAFFRIGRFQPVSRTAMPPQYLEAKNGRLLWSMKMYMTKMGARFHKDVIGKTYAAEQAGLNTKEGQKLLGEALRNAGKYATYVVALNTLVDPGRKWVMRGKEPQNSPEREFARQGTSFASAGLIDIDAPLYGRGQSEGLIPPAVQLPYSGIEVALKFLNEGDVAPSDMERMARMIPGLRQVLYARDVVERDE